jgi:hypothetical protein
MKIHIIGDSHTNIFRGLKKAVPLILSKLMEIWPEHRTEIENAK